MKRQTVIEVLCLCNTDMLSKTCAAINSVSNKFIKVQLH